MEDKKIYERGVVPQKEPRKKSNCSLERYQRITGYFQSTHAWNPGKVSELKDRKYYNIEEEKLNG